MKITLQSDFVQFYDHLMFPPDGADRTWVRNSRSTMTRKDMFQYLVNCGFKTPINGVVKDTVPMIKQIVRKQYGMEDEPKIELATSLTDHVVQQATKAKEEQELETMFRFEQEKQVANLSRVVVYTDEFAHRGEGKILLDGKDALAKYPDLHCSQYIPTRPDGGSASERVVTVGQNNFRLECASDDWRSNYGKEAVTAVTHKFPGVPAFLVNTPIFAIDYVRYGNEFLAIDFNESPDLDVLKKFLEPNEVYEILEEFFNRTPQPAN